MAQERQFGQRFLRAARAVVCIEAAGSVRCVWGARGRWDGRSVRYGLKLRVVRGSSDFQRDSLSGFRLASQAHTIEQA